MRGCAQRRRSRGDVALGQAPNEFVLRQEHACLELLEASRGARHPTLVSEVVADLSTNRGHTVAEEVAGHRVVVVPGGMDQCQAGDLFEVFLRDAPTAILERHCLGDTHVDHDHLARGGWRVRIRCPLGNAFATGPEFARPAANDCHIRAECLSDSCKSL